MFPNTNKEDRRYCVRIAVDATLLFQAVGMDNFKPCNVLTVSAQALEMIAERSIPVNTIVTVMVDTNESPERFYPVHGKVLRREYREAGWMHVVVVTSQKPPWPAMFPRDVMYSTYESLADALAGTTLPRERIDPAPESASAKLDAREKTSLAPDGVPGYCVEAVA